jgi:sugar lactone lactonase YvrE
LAPLAYVVELPVSGGSDNVVAVPVSGGAATPVTTMAGQNVVAASVDGSDTLYLENRVTSTDTMYVYARGTQVPARSFTLSPHIGPVRFALDAANRLYVPGGGTNVIDVYNATTGALMSSSPSPVSDPFAIAVSADGTEYIAGHSPEVVAVVPSGASSPSQLLSITNGTPRSIAVDSADRLYVATDFVGGGSVQMFLPGQSIPQTTLAASVPSAVAVDASDDVYVATGDGVINGYSPGLAAALPTLTPAAFPVDFAI